MAGFRIYHCLHTKTWLLVKHPIIRSATKRLINQQSFSRYHRRSPNAFRRPAASVQGHLLLYPRPTRHNLHLSSVLMPPAVFLGLLVTLWAYKSLMLVIFQNKIIYMPSVPPFSRSEKTEDYAAGCRPVVWKEARIRAADGTKLTLAVGEIPESVQDSVSATGQSGGAKSKRVVIVYFQGYVVDSFLFPC